MPRPKHWAVDAVCSFAMMLFLLGLAGYAVIQHFFH
jgi:hypothetical protein